MSETHKTIYLKDYQTPAWLIDQVELTFALGENATTVTSRLQLRLNPDRNGVVEELSLDGEHLELLSIKLDGRDLKADDYSVDPDTLRIAAPPQRFVLETQTRIDPVGNTALEGLYLSSGNFCTQCEAQGFRRISYYPDRPDVLAPFRVRIEAEKKYKHLLSNGNLLDSGDLDNGRHYAQWEDPFPKPSYLFALVAGDLVCLQDHYTTASGRDVLLQIYVEARNRDYCDHAMVSLKKSMQWDEEVYGLEYDLDRFMIVAVDDFNMGAMENKGLNVFNSKYVLAHPQTATDSDYLGVESVIAHEYFHNWTGNRVTCRDWFQLSLKEGLTVFRDQEFSADMNSAAVQRIDDVRILRQVQFPEDAGPMAHPIRPSAYVEINNFYTATVYNKGAEIIRMLQTLLGRDAFIRAVQLYLQRHDGTAATCDDFVAAMEEVGGIDLSQFKRWYVQAGTPVVAIEQEYDVQQKTLTLNVTQSCPSTPGQELKEPFHIPVALGFLDQQGAELELLLQQPNANFSDGLLHLKEAQTTLVFGPVAERPVLSPLRGFSAPVRIEAEFCAADLALRMASDSDAFNRWEAGQMLATRELLQAYQSAGDGPVLSTVMSDAWGKALADQNLDCSLLSQLLTLPSEQYLAEQLETFDPQRIRDVREQARRELAEAHGDLLLQRYYSASANDAEFSLSPATIGRRALQAICLQMLMCLDSGQARELAVVQYGQAQTMTERLASLSALIDSEDPRRTELLDDFYNQWKKHPLLLDKWFSLQALSKREGTFAEVERLLDHPDFTLSNPNRARSLLGGLCQNMALFHREDGRAYRFMAEQILKLDKANPQIAARMATPLTRWRRLEPLRRELLRQQLEQLQMQDLSRDLFEIVSKAMGQ